MIQKYEVLKIIFELSMDIIKYKRENQYLNLKITRKIIEINIFTTLKYILIPIFQSYREYYSKYLRKIINLCM